MRRYFKLIDDKYEILNIIRKTLHSEVYLVRHKALDVKRIAKVMRKENSDYRRILKEAHLIKNFKHSGIPIIYDIYDCNDSICIIEEYISGKCLTEYIKEHTNMSYRQIARIGISICKILEYLHNMDGMSIVYLDLKPDNIIVDNNDTVSIIDYDSSQVINSDDEVLKCYGTVGFAAPEQYHCKKLSYSADIYGLGMLLKYMAANGNIQSVLSNLQSADMLNQKKLNPIYNKCIRHNRMLRYKSVKDIRKDLEQLLYVNKKQVTGKSHNIYVYGRRSGVGATHLCLCLASFLAKRKYKTVCIEDSRRNDLRSMALKGSICRDGTFYYKGINILPGYSETVKYDISDYDFRIIDCGSSTDYYESENIWDKKYGCSSMKILVDVIRYDYDMQCSDIAGESDDLHIFLNHISGRSFYKIAGILQRKNVYRIPCIYDYNDKSDILEESFKESLNEAFPGLCISDKKTYGIERSFYSIVGKIKTSFRKKVRKKENNIRMSYDKEVHSEKENKAH